MINNLHLCAAQFLNCSFVDSNRGLAVLVGRPNQLGMSQPLWDVVRCLRRITGKREPRSQKARAKLLTFSRCSRTQQGVGSHMDISPKGEIGPRLFLVLDRTAMN